MALKEGRCTNCGSIIQLDPASEKGHCIFCDAVFENEKAFSLMQDVSDYEFKNEEQPKYEGPDLNSTKQKQVVFNTAPKAKIIAQKTASDAYVPVAKEEIKGMKLSLKTKVKMISFVAVIGVIIVAITVPLILKREEHKKDIENKFLAALPIKVDQETGMEIRNYKQDLVDLVTKDKVEDKEVIEIFKSYCDIRAEVKALDKKDFKEVYGSVTLKIATPEGGYVIENPENEAEFEKNDVVKHKK